MQNANDTVSGSACITLRDETKADNLIEKKVATALARLMREVDGPHGKDDAQCIALSVLHAEIIRRMVGSGQISSVDEAANRAVGVAGVIFRSEFGPYWEKQQIAREFGHVARGPAAPAPVKFDWK